MEKFASVLFVDDDPVSNYMGKQMITKLKLSDTVLVTCNGKEALELIAEKNFNPEIIFLDLNMPLINGYEFLEIYLKTFSSTITSIIILTSSEDGRDLDKVQAFGIKYYLSKPLIEDNLLKICEIIKLNIKLKFVMLAS